MATLPARSVRTMRTAPRRGAVGVLSAVNDVLSAVNDEAAPGPVATADRAPAAAPQGQPERSVYRSSPRINPAAAIASLAMVGVLAGAMVLVNLVTPPAHERGHIISVALSDLGSPPPPSAATATRQPLARAPAMTASPLGLAKPAEVPVVAPVPAAPAITPPPAIVFDRAAPVSAASPAPAPAPPSDISGGDLSSTTLSAPPPRYPAEAAQRREQGTVKLWVLVGVDGAVRDLRVLASSGSFRLDRAAMGAVRHWRWSPRVVAGVPVEVHGAVTIPFIIMARGADRA